MKPAGVSYVCDRCSRSVRASTPDAAQRAAGPCPACLGFLRAAVSTIEGRRQLWGGLCPTCLDNLDHDLASDQHIMRLFAGLHPFCARGANVTAPTNLQTT